MLRIGYGNDISNVDTTTYTKPFSVYLTDATGNPVGITASATDADSTNSTVTYTLSDDAGGRFSIDSGTGVVTVANGTLLDFETATQHTITARASSSAPIAPTRRQPPFSNSRGISNSRAGASP